ncbi:PTS sugar transporter subunit IIA [Orenia metallireducens]|uniref:PTS sugar transporter subunit IIA n=1 Tax=Orenia metallireducens TaxID=1413210 RepID=UPI0009F728B4|nr:PTS sugar transporter subunit IIA [Orenia metallireducens]
MLLNLLLQERIATKIKAKDWYDVTNKAGELLLKDDLIENRYIDAMIKSIEVNGPYIVIAKGVAILHARSEDGVKNLGMSLLTLASPIKFGYECNDPIQIAFALGALDRNKYLQALSDLSLSKPLILLKLYSLHKLFYLLIPYLL